MKQMIASLCVGASFVLASTTAFAAPSDPGHMTTREFLAACEQDAAWCQMWVSIKDASAAWNSAESHVCGTGDAAAITGPILDWMRAHPETADEIAESTMGAAMRALWPCA